MTETRACVLGCRNAEKIPFRAAPGLLACHQCSERLRTVLDAIAAVYERLTEVDELVPGGHGDTGGGRKPPGPRSPAVDGLLVHSDPRSVTGVRESPAALASIAGWARLVREERSLDVAPDRMRDTVPAGRVSMARELATLRFHWEWIMGQPWVDDFAAEMRDLLAALRRVGRLDAPELRIGKCPVVLVLLELGNGDTIDLDCGASLRVRTDATEVRCRNCGTTWPRDRWHELGDQWTDYAFLAAELAVPPGTLRRWAHEDKWAMETRGGRRLVSRVDALASYDRRRRKDMA